MTLNLAKLITYCKERGIVGSYRIRRDKDEPDWWAVRITVGMVIHSARGPDADEVMESLAASVLDGLVDPCPTPGTKEFAEWRNRKHEANPERRLARESSARRGKAVAATPPPPAKP